MMSRKTILLSIAGLSTFIHVCMLIFTAYALIQVCVTAKEPAEDEDGNTALAFVESFVIIILVITLLLEIAVLVVSILLILGIKKERYQFVAAWIYLTGIYTTLSCISLIRGSNALDITFGIKVTIIILHAAMWYPIYMFWRELRISSSTNIRENAPLNVGFTTQVPGAVYNSGPPNWQQGQTSANYYPAPGNGPQIQTGTGYYPPQNYAGGQIQRTVNPQLSSVSYPRQMAATAEGANESESIKPKFGM